ncbi:hypothetical protein K523DRAFT_354034 [Schizophyllum commune Tattone D]|nr:hypothetical protein K523DRAFT_354034 [Schizophyllum commune Tattone D]
MPNRPQHWDRPLADLGQPPTSLERPSASQRQPAANWEHDPPDSARAVVHGSYGSIVAQAPDGDQYGPTRFHAQPTHSYTQPTRFYAQPPGAMLPQSSHIVPPPSIPIALPPLSEIMRSRPPDPLSASLPLSVMPGVMSAPTSAAVAGLVVRAVTRHDLDNPPQRRVVPPLQLKREEPQLGTEAAHPREPRQHRAEDPPRRYADQPPPHVVEHPLRRVEHPPRHVEHPPRCREPKVWQIILPTSKILPEHMDLLTGIIRKRADLAVLAGPASPSHTVVFSPDIDLAELLRFYRMALPESNQVFLAGSPLSSCQVSTGHDLCQKHISAHRLRNGDYDYHVKIGQRLCTWMQCRFSVSLDTEDENAYLTLCAHMAARHFGQTPMCPLCRRVLRVPKDVEWEAYDLIKKHFMTGLCLELAKHAINTVAKPVPRPVLDADDGLAPRTTGSE